MSAPEHAKIADALLRALHKILRPLARVLLRYGVPYTAFEDVARHVFIETATTDFALPGRKPSDSRIAILTGLKRRELVRYRDRPLPYEGDGEERVNRAARVIAGWRNDPDFLDGAGRPRLLEFEAGEHSFCELARRHGGDIPGRAMLDELLRVGAAEKREDGRIRLLSRAYVPGSADVDTVAVLGAHVPELIETIEHNLESGAEDAFFQRRVFCLDVPASKAPALRASISRQGQGFLEKLHEELYAASASRGGDAAPADGEETVRVVLGMHYYQSSGDAQE